MITLNNQNFANSEYQIFSTKGQIVGIPPHRFIPYPVAVLDHLMLIWHSWESGKVEFNEVSETLDMGLWILWNLVEVLLANPGTAFARITEMNFFSSVRYKLLVESIDIKLIYSKSQAPQIFQMTWVLFVSLFWIISRYSSLLDIVIQVTPYVAWIPFSRVTAASCNCVCDFF